MRRDRRRKANEVQMMVTSLRQTSEEWYALREMNKQTGRTKSDIIRHALAVAFPLSVFPTFEEQDEQVKQRRKRSRRVTS